MNRSESNNTYTHTHTHAHSERVLVSHRQEEADIILPKTICTSGF